MYEHAGYVYTPEDEIMEDNRKIHHLVFTVDGDYAGCVPLSPYSYCTRRTFEMWIDCERPERFKHNVYGSEQIEKYFNSYIIENILLEGEDDKL
jgi:hypothetical protein